MRAVAIGSSAEHGSSIRITSGSHGDGAGDAQPLLLAAGHAERRLFSRSLTSSHSAAPRSDCSTMSSSFDLPCTPLICGP